jgi:hypothetical protein
VPWDRRGTRHNLASLLMTSVAAVLAGARSFTAVSEWVADAPPQVLAALGVRRDLLPASFSRPGRPPSAARHGDPRTTMWYDRAR